MNTLTELQTEVEELHNYCQELTEENRKQEQEFLNKKLEEGTKKLSALTGHINTLAAELETEILKFKEVAVEVNCSYHAIQQLPNFTVMGCDKSRFHWRPSNIWQVDYLAIPTVIRLGCKFVLTTKFIDMFKNEPEIDVQQKVKKAIKSREAFLEWFTKQRRGSPES
ncbi:MAG: hypothetical protein RMY64_11635 [Nostoc sp. DedQUE08]|uniref:hypothetical protein n=1 Tax=Nostoc sp. DedQUE08 TaxID=3075393 RepID=UPI002AD34AD7|nr:hypothetical protein [Nostoc sp. DedQUE08]MDZ8066272.1 hypothetical protein [Nostoc sp. DedQUE08]